MSVSFWERRKTKKMWHPRATGMTKALLLSECRPPIYAGFWCAHAFSSKVKRNYAPPFLKNTPSRDPISKNRYSCTHFQPHLPYFFKMCRRLTWFLTKSRSTIGTATRHFGRKPRKSRYFDPYFPEKRPQIPGWFRGYNGLGEITQFDPLFDHFFGKCWPIWVLILDFRGSKKHPKKVRFRVRIP